MPEKKKSPPQKTRSRRLSENAALSLQTPPDHGGQATSSDGKPPVHPVSIVGIGASAGGLEAFEQLLRAIPADTGMGFVLVQHLAPTHQSILSELLSKAT